MKVVEYKSPILKLNPNKGKEDIGKPHFDWVKWRREVFLSKPKKEFNVEALRMKYAEFNLESQEAIKKCNTFAKNKCKSVISGQKVHMLASLPHEKSAHVFDWEKWNLSGLKALKKRSEISQHNILKEIASIGESLPQEDQLFFSECMEHFLLNGLQSLYNGFYSGLYNGLKGMTEVIQAADCINNWAKEEEVRITQFFY